jgi:ABC-type Fe3+/spermidine/putrescine transport system ATPase subunit
MVEVLVRPEALEAVVEQAGHATLVERTFLGSLTRMRVALDDGSELLIDAASRRGLPEPGERVGVRAIGEDGLVSGPLTL